MHTNGQAERYVQMLKNKLQTIKREKHEIKTKLCKILLAYRRRKYACNNWQLANSTTRFWFPDQFENKPNDPTTKFFRSENVY